MATDEGSLPEIAQYNPYYLPLNAFTASKRSKFYILSFCAEYSRPKGHMNTMFELNFPGHVKRTDKHTLSELNMPGQRDK